MRFNLILQEQSHDGPTKFPEKTKQAYPAHKGKGMSDYRPTAEMLQAEIERDDRFVAAVLDKLAVATTNLDAYEALERLETIARERMQRYRSIAAGIAYKVLQDAARSEANPKQGDPESRNNP